MKEERSDVSLAFITQINIHLNILNINIVVSILVHRKANTL